MTAVQQIDFPTASAKLLSPKAAMRREKRAAERAAAIVFSTYRLLGIEGLEGLTIRAVLKAAAVNRRSFYEHFPGKDELVLAVFTYAVDLAARTCRDEIAGMDNPMDRLRAIIFHLVIGRSAGPEKRAESLRRGSALCREHMRLAEARPDDLKCALEPLLDLLAETVSAGIERGLVRDYAADRLASLVYNLLSTTVHAELIAEDAGGSDPARRERLGQEIWEFCRHAIAA